MLDTFDVVIQLSRKKLLNYILENILIQNAPIVPNFQLNVQAQGNSFQSILDGVDLVLEAGTNQAKLTYHVYAASASVGQQPHLGFTDGQIIIPVELTVGEPFKVRLQSAEFQTTQTSQIGDPNSFFQQLNGMLTAALDTSSEWNLFPGTPDVTAQFLIGLALNGQVLCLDAETLVAVIGQGDLSKVSNFLNFEDCAVGLSAALAKNTILFPSEITLLNPQDVANLLGITLVEAADDLHNPTPSFVNAVRPLLPAPFGSGSPKQSKQGVDTFFDFIDFTFTDGAIQMTGKFHGEAFCVHITDGQFEETVQLSIQNQKVVSTFFPNPPQPVYSANFDFWCGLGFIFLASNVALVTGVVVTIILIAVATGIKVQQQQLSQNPFSAPVFDQVTWNAIQILSEGLVLRGFSSASVGYDVTLPGVVIGEQSYPLDVEKVGSGVYDFPGNLSCKAQQFAYDEYRQNVSSVLDPQLTGLLPPITTTWYVNGIEITGPSGIVNFTALAHAATPPFNEVTLPNHPCSVNYTLFGLGYGNSELVLWMPESDYNFDLPVELVAVDASGRTYTDNLVIHVMTDYVQFGQDYIDFQKQCGLAAKFNIGRIRTVPQGVLRGGDPLTPSEITTIVREIVAEQPAAVAIDLVRSLVTTYGAAPVLKAFAPVSSPARRTGGTNIS